MMYLLNVWDKPVKPQNLWIKPSSEENNLHYRNLLVFLQGVNNLPIKNKNRKKKKIKRSKNKNKN